MKLCYIVFCILICVVGAVTALSHTEAEACRQFTALTQSRSGLGDYDLQHAAEIVAEQLKLQKSDVLRACQLGAVDGQLQEQQQRKHSRSLLQDDDYDDGDEPAWDEGIASVQPRLSINAISNRDDDDMYKIMYLMALHTFMYKSSNSGKYSYYAIAGIHGLNWDYNGQTPKGDSGFCKHDHAQFPTWHRPYMRLYEVGLQRSCYRVANRFVEDDQRIAANRTCKILRAPWWDIVKGETPGLLQRKTVTMYNRDGTDLVERKNPFRKFCFSEYVESVTEGSKGQGDCVARANNWAVAMRNVAANTADGLKSFYKGPWACTNTWQGNGCTGNLEAIHNTWHQAVGGDVVWLAWAGFDPFFWLFHMAMDRYLYLWQVAAQDHAYAGSNNYKPFPKSASCGGNLASCKMKYGSRKTGSRNNRGSANLLRTRDHLTDDQVAVELLGNLDDTSGTDPTSPQALAYLAAEFAELPVDTDTYSWNAVFNRLDPYALKNRTFSLHVFLRPGGSADGAGALAELPMDGDGKINTVDVQLKKEWCGSYGSFVTWMGDMPDVIRKNRTVPVPLGPCLKRNGLATNMGPKDPSDPTLGPASLPITRPQLQVLCVDGKGQDCTELVKNAYSLGLGWQASTDSYNPAVQMFSSPHIAHQVSLMAVSEPETDAGPRLRALGLEQPQRPLPLPYLHTQQVDSF